MQTLVSSSHSHLKFLKLLKFLKVLENTTCFGQYGHPQVLKFLVGETAAIVCVPSMRTYVCNMCEKIFVRIFVREVYLYCVVTGLCTHCNHTIQSNFTYKNSNKFFFMHVTDVRAHRRGTYNSSSFPPLKILTPEDGHIGQNM
jgi:hypothetical protein